MTVESRVAAKMERLSRWSVLAITGVGFASFATFLFASSVPFSIPHVQELCGQAPPDMRFFTSGAEVHGFMTTCGEAGRSAYRNPQVADLFYPAVFGLFMASALSVALSRSLRKERFWVAATGLPPAPN